MSNHDRTDVGQAATGSGFGARASFVRQLSIASFNVDRAGASKVQHTLDFAKNFQADAYALQADRHQGPGNA